MHIPTISTKESVRLIREAKQKQLNVTCSVAIHNLLLEDSLLEDFDTRFKVNPPLRIKEDIDALIDGLKDGTIDFVTSDHNPQTIEDKKVEFDHATYGTIGLESAFGALNSILDLQETITLLTKGRSLFNLENQSIKVGNAANLSLFNPNIECTFTKKNIISTSKNSAFLGQHLKGKSYGVYANKKLIIND